MSARNTHVQWLKFYAGDQVFDVSWAYDDLGNVSEVTYPICTPNSR